MTKTYQHDAIEAKWSDRWEAEGTYQSKVDWNKPKHYALTMLPYPSGDLHIGHWFAMTPSDARARYMRMRGYNVLFPMGFDAFGLPAEQAAISRNIHPWKWTYANIERMRKQLRSMGAMFDWSREAISCTPEYYTWTMWFFKKFFENDLAYRGEALVNWSPTLQTVLANEQVIDGKDERTGQPVVQKLMTQWFFRITKYADELLNFDQLDWPEPIKIMQQNWIGRSEGAKVTFHTEAGDPFQIFTTRPDTLWGATFMVLAPEHPLVDKVTTPEQSEAVEAYRATTARATEIERLAEDREKTGIFTGGYAINPVNQARIPIWIADYVMISYGTGAIMAVPAHDQRDFEFARKFGLEVRVVIQSEGEPVDGATMESAAPGAGVMVHSGPFDGTPSNDMKGRQNPAISAVIDWLIEQGIGQESVNYRLRDWLISRQRYWGAPIPIIYRGDGSIEAATNDNMPMLPEDVDFLPTGRSPLTYHEPFLNTVDSEGNPARRETDTMDTFMCSSWYQFRYLSPRYDSYPFDPEEAAYWLPVDVYTGGAEHATMHLLYARFFTKAMRDMGIFDRTVEIQKAHGRNPEGLFDEPMLLLRNQGQVLGAERIGDTIMAQGRMVEGKLYATHIEVLEDRNKLPADFDGIMGELMDRVENVLHIDIGAESWQIVEVEDAATIVIPNMAGEARIDQLKHHLDIQRMSKSKGNVVNPDELVQDYGADTVRAYLMFAFDWQKGGPWDPKGVQGVVRWVNDVWDMVANAEPSAEGDPEAEREVMRKTHQAIQKVGDSIDRFSFNTAVAALMALRNDIRPALRENKIGEATWRESMMIMLRLMAPITPYIAEELWEQLGGSFSIHEQAWPEFDPEIAAENEITLVVQVNGKVRDRIQVPVDISEEDAKAKALASDPVQRFMDGQTPKKVIYIAQRGMVNIVI